MHNTGFTRDDTTMFICCRLSIYFIIITHDKMNRFQINQYSRQSGWPSSVHDHKITIATTHCTHSNSGLSSPPLTAANSQHYSLPVRILSLNIFRQPGIFLSATWLQTICFVLLLPRPYAVHSSHQPPYSMLFVGSHPANIYMLNIIYTQRTQRTSPFSSKSKPIIKLSFISTVYRQSGLLKYTTHI